MKNLFQKSSLLKSGLAVAALAIGVINYSQSNESYSALLPKIIRANASVRLVENPGGGTNPCAVELNSTCSFTTSDGIPHTTSNAKDNK